VVSAPAGARACGFAETSGNPRTLRRDIAESKLVLFGRLANAREGPGDGSTDLVINVVFKPDPVLDGRGVVTIPRRIRIPDLQDPPYFLVFADVVEGKPDFYRGVAATPALPAYLNGLLRLADKDRPTVLRYCFDYLEHPDRAVAEDAYAEFVTAADADIARAAALLPPERLRVWLGDDKLPTHRARLYGFLLGNCGGDRDADLLRDLLEKRTKHGPGAELDGVITGYVLLRPREGWAFARALAADTSRHWELRYAAVRAARFFHATRPDVVAEKDLLDVVCILLDQEEVAAWAAVDTLDWWRCWELSDRVLALAEKTSDDSPNLRCGLIRYALQCPGSRAADFVKAARRTDPDLVKEVEDALKRAAAPAPAKKPPG
jgi:hypothetical protein